MNQPSRAFYLTLAVGVLVLGLMLAAVFLNACTIRLETRPDAKAAAAEAPPCCVVCTPIASPTKPAPTPVATQTPAPSPLATATPTRPAPAPSPSPTVIPAAGAFQTTGGRAVVRIDLTRFRTTLAPDGNVLDYYHAFSLLWRPPPGGSVKPDTPALEISIRGTRDELCAQAPCGDALGVVARWSCNVRFDAGEPDERKHQGEGINYRNRLAVGTSPVFDVVVTWGPDSRKVTVSTQQGSWTARRGVNVPGFGEFYATIPNEPKGVGWARSPWAIDVNGGTATLVSWERVDPVGSLSRCP